MSTVSNLPRGLVSLFGLKDMGESPRSLNPEIVATLDITEFLLLNRESIIPSTTTATTTGFRGLVSVPAGELWYIHGYSVQTYELVASVTATLRTAYTEAAQVHIGLGGPVSVAAASDNRLAMTASPFWAPAGATLGVWVETIAGAGTLACQAAVVISRLRI